MQQSSPFLSSKIKKNFWGGDTTLSPNPTPISGEEHPSPNLTSLGESTKRSAPHFLFYNSITDMSNVFKNIPNIGEYYPLIDTWAINQTGELFKVSRCLLCINS